MGEQAMIVPPSLSPCAPTSVFAAFFTGGCTWHTHGRTQKSQSMRTRQSFSRTPVSCKGRFTTSFGCVGAAVVVAVCGLPWCFLLLACWPWYLSSSVQSTQHIQKTADLSVCPPVWCFVATHL